MSIHLINTIFSVLSTVIVSVPIMSDWDDDDFEPEVQNLAPPPVVEDVAPEVEVPKSQPAKPKPKYMQKDGKTFNMEDLGRELTPKEREEIQRRSDLSFARELFGSGEDDDNHYSWDKIMTKDEFEMWGDKAGKYFATRHLAGHYGDFLSKLLTNVAAPLDAAEIRKMSNLLKQIADDKKAATDKEKKTSGPAAKKGAGKSSKPSLKSTGSKAVGGNMYDDYEGGGGGSKYDDYDDFM